MTYLPAEAEVKLLASRHPELSGNLLRLIVDIADRIRKSPELAGLSVRATEEACVYLAHPLMENDEYRMLPEVLKSSFCGRFSGRHDDPASDAGAAWAIVGAVLREEGKLPHADD
jgi:nitric oxide reductase NorQ protein